ncbi:RodZ domain-containing protein [Nitrosospira sp. Nsp1]|uniref:RodZ domain-containing protein n=1 Tax=Nitrosospira sp. Nsp1 TaxID=136547 RepID=UPI00088E8A4D|nr:RodZ domain-containing protein [Nitrosospira sp. Nsp1]SCX47501.1 cytoskeleton protein RodZ [Nitrosospira sp. Nsp1]
MDAPDNGDVTPGADEKPARTETGVGELLRAERVARGLSIEDVARQLRLAVRQVTALEEDDYDKLAGGTFARGFVRNYAKLLQMDAAPLLQQLDQSLPPSAPQTITYQIEGVPFPSKQKSGSRNLIIAGVIILALLLLIYEIYRGNEANIANIGKQPSVSSETGTGVEEATEPSQLQSPDVTPGGEGGVVSPAEEAAAGEKESAAQLLVPAPALVLSPPPARQAAPVATMPEPANAVSAGSTSQSANTAVASPVANGGANGIRLIFSGESWTEVKDGRGRLLLSRINPRGTEHVLQGTPPFVLTIGNAAEVKLVYNNKPVDLAPYTNAYGGTARLSLE